MIKSIEEQECYSLIDVCKFVFACCIPLLHIPFGNSPVINFLRQYLSRLGVPFFFCAAGFFLSKKLHSRADNHAVLRQYIKRIGSLLLIWTIVYFPVNFLHDFKSVGNIRDAVLLYVQEFLFCAPSYLWYLTALIIAAIPFCLLKNRPLLCLLACTSYILGTLGNTYQQFLGTELNWYYHLFLTTRNGIFFAPLFLYIGELCYQGRRVIKKSQVLTAYGLLSVEIFYAQRMVSPGTDTSMYFALPIFIGVLFQYLCQHSRQQYSKQFLFFRKTSIVIYVLQFGLITCGTFVWGLLGNPYSAMFQGLTIYISTVLISVLLSVMTEKYNTVLKRLF